MRIYIFENTVHNDCRGDFHFLAESYDDAIAFAKEFEKQHNLEVSYNINYKIFLKFKDNVLLMSGYVSKQLGLRT